MKRVILIEFRTADPYPVLLANALSGLCDLTLMLPRQTSVAGAVDQSRVKLQSFHMPRLRQLGNISMIRHILTQLNQIHPDVVHVSFWSPWMMPAMARFLNLPWVATVHDVERHLGERGLWAIPSALYRWQWQWAHQVIVHATAARHQLVTRYGCAPERVHTIPIGAYELYRTPSGEARPERPNTVLFFGRIWGYKGLRYLIEAEPLISRAIPEVRIIIAGEGESFDRYRQLMANSHQFEVHNYRIPDDKVAALFQQASLVVLPYVECSQSGVVSVAYAFGKPVITTRVGGLPDVVIDGQTGLLVPPADSRGLAEAIITLLQDAPLRHKMGQQARQFADTELSWPNIAQKTVGVYQQAIQVGYTNTGSL